MNDYQEIQVAIKVIEKHFKEYDREVKASMDVNLTEDWSKPLDQDAIVDSIKGLSVLIAFESVIKELKKLASSLERVKNS